MKSLFNLATKANPKNGANLTMNKKNGLPFYLGKEPIKVNANGTNTKSNSKVNGVTNCIPYKPTLEQIAKRKKKDCFEMLQKFDYMPLTISLNKLKTNIFEIDKKLSGMKSKSSKKITKKNPNRCDSEDISFIKVKKMFVYSINVLESTIKKMKKIVILPDENNCPEAVEPVIANAGRAISAKNNGNLNAKLPVARRRGGSATNDICTDYNEIIANIRDIITNIDNIIGNLRIEYEKKNTCKNKKRSILLLHFEDDTIRPVLRIEDKYIQIINRYV
jgi:methyl-accepting chemotaxis protein